MLSFMKELRKVATLGVVGGSDFVKIYEQLGQTVNSRTSATTISCSLIELLILMSCPSVGPDGLVSLKRLKKLIDLDLSYTFLVDLQTVFESCMQFKVLKLQACKYLDDTSLGALYLDGALRSLWFLLRQFR